MKVPAVSIIGRANVGKSSIFNRLASAQVAITADEPGTTRDAISRLVELEGQSYRLIDTAGLKQAEDEMEMSIQEQIEQSIDSADLILFVADALVGITQEDQQVAKLARKSSTPVILVINKAESGEIADFSKLGFDNVVLTSATQKTGIDELAKLIKKSLPKVKSRKSDTITFSFIGRPNVGKSSLFNSLAKKQQAVVSSSAGTTRDVNLIELKYKDQNLTMLDTAGIRRPGKVERGVEAFSVIRTLRAIDESDICFLVLDTNEPYTKLDQRIAGMIADAKKGLVIVLSKWDSIDSDEHTRDEYAARLKRTYDFIAWAPVIITSSESGQNVSKIMEFVLEIDQKRQTELKTADLNRWLEKQKQNHPPAGLKNKHPKLRYITQTGVKPPTFTVFGTDTKYLHWSYKRYLEKQLRAMVDLSGSAVEFIFTDKEKE